MFSGMSTVFSKIGSLFNGTGEIIDAVYRSAVQQTGAVVDSEAAKLLKSSTYSAYETAKSVGTYLGDVNGDGNVDAADVQAAAEKAGLLWNMIDPDLKTALVAGAVAGAGVNFVPLIGQLMAVPAFAATTAYFFLVAKLRTIGKS